MADARGLDPDSARATIAAAIPPASLAAPEVSLRTPWFSPRPGPVSADRPLFCFPHAGGTAAAFRAWGRRLAAEVMPVHFPGRAGRLREAPFRNLRAAAEAAATAIAPGADRPFVFFGHSLGALMAFETARALRRLGAPEPAHLFVSARRGPRLPEPESSLVALPDDAFVAEVQRRYAAIPAEVAAEPELMELLLPVLRADFEMLETYEYLAEPPLGCPITASAGDGDPRATPALCAPWRDETEGGFDMRIFAGGHFYLDGPAAGAFFPWLERRLQAVGDVRAPSASRR